MSKYVGVYVIGSSVQSHYKIGLSHNLVRRLASYKTLPTTFDVQHMWLVEDCKKVECELHHTYADSMIRANGVDSEWFALSDEQLRTLYQTLDARYNRLALLPVVRPKKKVKRRAKRKLSWAKRTGRWAAQPISASFVRG